MNNYTIAAQTIKDTVSALDVGHALGLEIRHGRCKCPIHGGNDFNCVLYSGNRGFYCHVCKEGGDVIRFVQRYYDTKFNDAVSWLNDTFHMGLDLNSTITPEKRRQAEMAQRMRKNAIEFQHWKEIMGFELALTAFDIVRNLEELRDRNAPKTPDEEWSPAFIKAVRWLPTARRFADDCMMNCVDKECGNDH